MATIRLPADFHDFLRLLTAHEVEYLLVGGYAVCFYGFIRTTADMDVWIHVSPDNAAKMSAAVREFGFDTPELTTTTFMAPDRIIRMGIEPVRIEILTGITGCEFVECYARRVSGTIDGTPVSLISRSDLVSNKRQAGRPQDLVDARKLEP